jgi:hypothetical protein
MDIRSYRAVFELERRVYRVDSIRLNPGGIPLRGLLYAAALILLTLVADRLPPVGFLLAPLPWYVRFLGLPIAVAGLATVVRIEARPFHLALWSIIAHRLGPAHTRGLTRAQAPGARWHPGPVLLIVDGSDARLRRLRYRGPGAVLVCCRHDRVEWPRPVFGARRRGADVTLHAGSDARRLERPAALEIAAGGVVVTTARPLA